MSYNRTVTSDEIGSFTPIIDGILAASDLNTISAKRIRKGLQAQVNYDLTPKKDGITELIMQRFDAINEKTNGTNGTDVLPSVETDPTPTHTSDAPKTNGTTTAAPEISTPPESATASPKKRSEPSEDFDLSSPAASFPPKKKQKKTTTSAGDRSVEEDDAAFAARLQAEENSRARARATRGGGAGTKKRAPVKKGDTGRKKKKSANKVREDDDSEIESGGEEGKKEVKRTGGFHKPMALSAPLSALLGETQLSRPQTVKKIWEYVKQRDLQDPSDKRQIRCDDAMRAVFKSERVHMFTMNKILNQNLYALDE
ncbi:SWIB-domain-containing protein [Patellaria atrata CBS 101060]|uniref:SWIB-domain-containing protein n=1 Tax=Patellaria atrata CBS 101060 TaxID=1346257 RepID=A0A9P4SHQ2_9PEZI|nr:SWIB-domain-containing protein [Patellaria atrata CBS 101060]